MDEPEISSDVVGSSEFFLHHVVLRRRLVAFPNAELVTQNRSDLDSELIGDSQH